MARARHRASIEALASRPIKHLSSRAFRTAAGFYNLNSPNLVNVKYSRQREAPPRQRRHRKRIMPARRRIVDRRTKMG